MKKSQSSDYMTRLEKTLAIDDDGNANFAKSVLADGTIGGNSGLKILKTYNMSDTYTSKTYNFSVLFEGPLDDDDHYSAFGYIEFANLVIYPCMAWYSLNNNSIVDFKAICIDKICEFRNNAWQETLIATQNV